MVLRPGRSPSSETSGHRTDIEGLRGVAVLVVVLFHLRLSAMSGGFVGVDVFFVISGFLITRQLVASVEGGGAHLPTFWARRLRRLAPLLFLTIVGTLAASLVVYSPLEWRRMAEDAAAATVYASNVVFARDGTQYFQEAQSPFLHLWSLGVEEQFYLLWPVLIAATALVARRAGRVVRRYLTWSIGLATAASFLVALVLTDRGTPWSFFSPISRAWEFGIGALVAVVDSGRRLPRSATVPAAWAGGLAIVASSICFDSLTPTPSWSTLLPVLGAAAVLVDSPVNGRWAFARWVSVAPLRVMGRVSYAWYLLHWPAIVLAEAALVRPDAWVRWVAGFGSFAGAVVFTRWVEAPIRRRPRLGRPIIVYPLALGVSLSMLAACVAVVRWADRRLEDPYLAHLVAVRESRTTDGSGACVDEEIAPGLVECVYGDPSSETTIMLVGDSHAAQWAPAAEVAAEQLHARLVIRTYGGCPALDVFVRRTGFDDASPACLAFRDRTDQLIDVVRPAAVLVGSADFTSRLLDGPEGSLLDRAEALVAFEEALSSYVTKVRDVGGELGLVLDNPPQATDPIECLAGGASVEHCSISTVEAQRHSESFQDALRRVAVENSLPLFDAFDLVCDDSLCRVAVGDLVVYADADHLSLEFTRHASPEFARFVDEVLDRG